MDYSKDNDEERKPKVVGMTFVLDEDVEAAQRETLKIEDELQKRWERQRLEQLHGYNDSDGHEIVPRRYQEVLKPSDGMIAVRSGSRWGYYNMQGQLAIPFEYSYAYSFSEGLAGVCKKGKCGFIDKNGQVVIPFRYDTLGLFSEGMAKVSINNRYGYINRNGEVVIPIENKKFSSDFHEGLAWGWGPQRGVGFFDKQGNIVIPYEYRYGSDFQYGLAAVKKGDLWGMINKLNEVVVPFEYQSIRHAECRRRVVEKNGKYGFLDEQGKLVIDIKYDYADSFDPESETAFVEIGENQYDIDTDGEIVEWYD